MDSKCISRNRVDVLIIVTSGQRVILKAGCTRPIICVHESTVPIIHTPGVPRLIYLVHAKIILKSTNCHQQTATI